MSLLDTINEAKKEAKANFGGDEKGAEGAEGAEGNSGFLKKSATRAKPAREASQGVYTESKPKDDSKKSKEEKREEKNERRSRDSRRSFAAEILLRETPGYRELRRLWIIVSSIAAASAVIGFLLVYIARPRVTDEGTIKLINTASIVLMVLAYLAIFYAFYIDLRKIRKLRNSARERVSSMTDKKVYEIVEGAKEENAKKRIAEAEAKAESGGANKASGNKKKKKKK